MSCKETDRYLDGAWREPLAAVPPALAAHLEGCPRCRSLVAMIRQEGKQSEPPVEAQSKIETALLGSLQPVKPLPPGWRLAAGFVAAFVMLSAAGVLLMGDAARQAMQWWQFAGVAGVLSGSAVLLAVALSRQMAPGGYVRHRMVCPKMLLWWVAPAFVVALVLLFPWPAGGGLPRGGRCLGAGLLLAAPAMAAFWLLFRRGAILSPGLAGASMGLLAGLAGALVLHFGCIILEAPHLALWHGAIPVASALLGFAAGKLLTRASRQ